MTWWRSARARSRVLVVLAGVLVLGSMLVTGVFDFLLAPPDKILVVTMTQEAGQSAREALRADCGRLPGVGAVADKGNPDPRVQGRFPVRFDIGRADAQQESALYACINGHPSTVRGYVTEGDR